MSILLTSGAYAAFRRLRRTRARGHALGPRWTVLGTDVLFAALELAGVAPQTLLNSMTRWGDRAELGRRSPVFDQLLPQLPSCSFIRTRLGTVEIRCGSGCVYVEEYHRPLLIVPNVTLPEQVIIQAPGRRLSRICDLSGLPALAHVDPIIRSVRNAMHGPSGLDARTEFRLDIGWRAFGQIPIMHRTAVDQTIAKAWWPSEGTVAATSAP